MPLLCCSSRVLMRDLRSKVPVQHLPKISTYAAPGWPLFRGLKGEAATLWWSLVTRFGAWLHLVRLCRDLSSKSLFDPRILKYFDLGDQVISKFGLN